MSAKARSHSACLVQQLESDLRAQFPTRIWTARELRVLSLRAVLRPILAPQLSQPGTGLRLFDETFLQIRELPAVTLETAAEQQPTMLVPLLEELLAAPVFDDTLSESASRRGLKRRLGAYYTPTAIVEEVVQRALGFPLREATPMLRVCDPAVGAGRTAAVAGVGTRMLRVCDPAVGAGAFLLGVARQLSRAIPCDDTDQRPMTPLAMRQRVLQGLFGFDVDPLAVAVTEASLAWWLNDPDGTAATLRAHVELRDSLSNPPDSVYDLVIGNPPWVAFAGRASQPLEPSLRAHLRRSFAAFRGYPTLHGCFVELACRLAPDGRIALLLPSPVADLEGYAPIRRVLTARHQPELPLIEYGQDAFPGVTQPCFGLIAQAVTSACSRPEPFSLSERSSYVDSAVPLQAPSALTELRTDHTFPSRVFRELGLQTTSLVTARLLHRGPAPMPPFIVPLLEGRDVSEFREGPSRLFFSPDPEVLHQARCRLRPHTLYRSVDFVIRQTARYPIAAPHDGRIFRNSLLAGFEVAPWTGSVLIGLLNSTLLRALHLSQRRDARQRSFPQVKIGHLRALPAPYFDQDRAHELSDLVRDMAVSPASQQLRQKLDAAVYAWFGVTASDATVIDRYYQERVLPQRRTPAEPGP